MVIEVTLRDPNLSIEEFLSCVRVCRAWASEVNRVTSHYASIQTRLLHLAARQNNIEAVDILLDDYGIDVNSNDETRWVIAKQHYRQVAEMFTSDNETGWTVLHIAAFHGHLGMFEHLIDKHKALEGKNEKYIDDLCKLAMCNSHTGILDIVVERYGPII